MAGSFFPVDVFGDNDNADDISRATLSFTNEDHDFLSYVDLCDEHCSFLTDSIPQTEAAQDEPSVPEQAADAPLPSNSASNSRAVLQPSKLDWENQKANIIALYREHKANELPRLMQDQYGFYAR